MPDTDLDTIPDAEPDCPKCGGDMTWVICQTCDGTGLSGHDCGEDTCVCLDPEDTEPCDVCDSEGGWNFCEGCCTKEMNYTRGDIDAE